jgi:hypothetical protein
MSPTTRVTYVTTDPKRQQIPYVKVEDGNGRSVEYVVDGVTKEQLAKGEERTMDCMDCHNRPSHRFDSTPEVAVDEALANGRIPRALPFARREAVAALKASYPSQAEASQAIKRRLTEFNIFPEMKVTWGTYPNNLGHTIFPGCFRCHDDTHKAKDGTTIRQDCELCHKQEG